MLALHVFGAPVVFYMRVETHFREKGLLTFLLPAHATTNELSVIKLVADVVFRPIDALEILARPCRTEKTPPDGVSSFSWGLHLVWFEKGAEDGLPNLSKSEVGLTLSDGALR